MKIYRHIFFGLSFAAITCLSGSLPAAAAERGCCKTSDMNGGFLYSDQLAGNCSGPLSHFDQNALVGKGADGKLTCLPKASNPKKQEKKKEPSIFSPPDISVAIPGLDPLKEVKCPEKGPCEVPWIGQYFAGLQRYGLGAIGLLSAIMLMIGGLVWLTSAGNAAAVGRAKKIIGGSLSGLVIAFASYLILYFINPKLVELPSLKITSIEQQIIPVQECANGDCQAAEEGIAALTLPVPKDFIKSIVVAGEGCNPKTSADGLGACGLGQVLPDNRRTYCGLPGTASDCDLMKNNPTLDIECVAKVMMAQAKESPVCGNFSDIRKTALCWNAGYSKTCEQTTDHYCDRVESYLTEKCLVPKAPTPTN